ncbi:MAG TPA: hypothetical protein VGE16_10775 [Albitalea sp.]
MSASKGALLYGTALLVVGVVLCIISAAELLCFLTSGEATYVSSKQGLTFVGAQAALLYAFMCMAGALLAVAGWGKVRRSRGGLAEGRSHE